MRARTRVKSTPEKTEVARPKSKHPKTQFLRKSKIEKGSGSKMEKAKSYQLTNEIAPARSLRGRKKESAKVAFFVRFFEI